MGFRRHLIGKIAPSLTGVFIFTDKLALKRLSVIEKSTAIEVNFVIKIVNKAGKTNLRAHDL